MGNTAHPNRGGDLSLYRPDGLEYKLSMFSNRLVGPGRLGTDQAINRD